MQRFHYNLCRREAAEWMINMKTTEEIYGALCADYTARTGIVPALDGDTAVRFYAVAAQLEALSIQADWVSRQCFPQSADGEFLELHAEERGLARRAQCFAEGVIRFSLESAQAQDVEIPAGTVCLTGALVRFETTEAGSIPAGETFADVSARCLIGGAAGNVPAGSICTMSVPPVGVSGCTNPAAFSGGSDTESDEALRARLLETYRRLPNGANAAFYRSGALSFPEVAAAVVVPRSRGIGTVDVVIAAQSGVPGDELIGEVQDYFDERREIAVDVEVAAPTTLTVNVTAAISAGEDAFEEVKERAEEAVRGYFHGGRLGEDILRARLGEILFSVPGVSNYALTSPASDVAVGDTVLPVLGTLTLTELT